MKKPSPEEAARLMREDKIRSYTLDPTTGEVNAVKSWAAGWVFFEPQQPKKTREDTT